MENSKLGEGREGKETVRRGRTRGRAKRRVPWEGWKHLESRIGGVAEGFPCGEKEGFGESRTASNCAPSWKRAKVAAKAFGFLSSHQTFVPPCHKLFASPPFPAFVMYLITLLKSRLKWGLTD